MSAIAIKPVRGNFMFAVSTLIAASVFFGFGFTVFPDLILRLRPAVLYLHALTAAAWIVLLVVQVALVRNRKVALHRTVGVYGLWLGAVAAATSFVTSLVLRHDSVIRHGADRMVERIAFLSIPLNGFVVFSVMLTLAAIWRRRPALHRRCMMLAAAVLMGPAMARVPVLSDLPHFADGVPDAVILLLCAHDYWTTRRVHPVYLAGLPAIIAMQLLTQYLYEQHPAWWVATARLLIGV